MTNLPKKKTQKSQSSKPQKKKTLAKRPQRKDSYGASERSERPLGHLRRSLMKHNRRDSLSIL